MKNDTNRRTCNKKKKLQENEKLAEAENRFIRQVIKVRGTLFNKRNDLSRSKRKYTKINIIMILCAEVTRSVNGDRFFNNKKIGYSILPTR